MKTAQLSADFLFKVAKKTISKTMSLARFRRDSLLDKIEGPSSNEVLGAELKKFKEKPKKPSKKPRSKKSKK